MTDPDRTPTIPRLRTRLVAIGTREDYHQWGARVALTSSHAAWSETLAEVVVDLRRRQFDAIFIPRDAIAAHGLLHLAEPVAAVVASPACGARFLARGIRVRACWGQTATWSSH